MQGLQRLAIWTVVAVFAATAGLGWSVALMLLVLLFLAEYLAAAAGVRAGLAAMLSLPKSDLARLKDLLTAAEQGRAVDPEEVRRILEKGFDRR